MTRRQCRKCPWKRDVDPNDIPNGYCKKMHASLKGTIATPGAFPNYRRLRVMACHDSKPGSEFPCVGWLVNQYDRGNNIALRLAVAEGRISMDVEVVGEQHETFEETLPR